jgi:predicted lipoprotein with Yx(FWY)xxD motif
MRSTGRHHTATTQRGLISGVAAVALVLLAGACGSSKTKASTATSAPATGSSGASAATVNAASTKLGQVLVDAHGRTLYTFDPENSGTIACLTGCVDTWPPDVVTGGSAPTAGTGVTVAVATTARPDGSAQVTAGGHPLYTYSGDKAAGDTNGDGIGGKWHAARPSGSAAGAGPTTATTAAGGYRY